jgi:glycosyltransferase involved in cell wall biosynthesis
MTPLISILIPAYNAQQWIADTIASALAQTWPRKEIIIVDDGSSDGTLEIADQFASKAVQVVRQPNQGVSVARNTALSISQGHYIQWLDADDLLAPDKIERQARKLDEIASKRTLLSGAWGSFMFRQRKAQFVRTPLWSDLTPVEWLILKMGNNLQMQTDNWLVSRELTAAAGPWDARLWKDNDGEYFCRVIIASDGIRFVPEARTYYRSASYKSVSYIGDSNKKLESLFLSMRLHMGYLRSLEDSERTRVACLKYIQTWLPAFHPCRPDIVRELNRIAVELGGQCGHPQLSWKYHWIATLFGWGPARRAEILLPKLKKSAAIEWDKLMLQLERGGRRNQRAPQPAK